MFLTMMFWFLFFCIIFVSISFGFSTILCDSKRDINLQYGEIAFIESPNFPETMTEIHKRECMINVNVKDKVKTDIYLLLVITNGYLEDVEITSDDLCLDRGYIDTSIHTYYFHTNRTNLQLKFSNSTVSSWNAFQGYITYDHKNEKHECPFTELTKPFKFENESQTFYIRSRYTHFCSTFDKQKCIWEFTGPKGYGFKFFLTNFDVTNTELLVTNSTDYMITDGHHTTKKQVFYNSDNNLIVNYQGRTICNNSAMDYLFEAQITIVKNSWTEVDANCGISKNGTAIIWSTKNSNSIGYPNNAQCTYNITVAPGTQIVATITKLRIEWNVDILEYRDISSNSDDDEEEWTKIELQGSTHVFRYNEPRKEENLPVIWRFKSDGSIQSNGFEVQFETIKCQCAYNTITVPCEGKQEYSIMGVKPYRVCGNLKCNITIMPNKNCPTQKYSMTTFRALECADVLNFYVYANNSLLINSSDFRLNYKTTFLLPSKINATFIFQSYEITGDSFFYFKLIPVGEPKIERIILTSEKPTFVVEMVYVKENTVIKVELSNELISKNDKLEMYASFENGDILTGTLLVDNENMNQVISNIVDLFYGDYSKYSANYTSPTNDITIYKPVKCPTDYAVLFFRAVNAHTSNCMFKKTIYNIGSTRPQANLDNFIAMHSTAEGPCELVFLNQPLAMKGLKEFWIHGHSGVDKPAILYSGLKNREQILNISEFETKPWKKIILGAMFYTLLIPPDTSLLVKTFDTYNLPKCTFGKDPFCSFIDTPYYGNPNTYKYQKKEIAFFIILCDPVIFTVNKFDVSKNGRLWFEANNNRTIDITFTGQKETFHHTNLSIYFYEYDLGHTGARIYITNVL